MLKAYAWVGGFLSLFSLIALGIWLWRLPCWRCLVTPNRYHSAPRGFYGGTSYRPMLKTLASAQADFRANDRDGNGINDFWRKDVAGLYVVPGTAGAPIKLIELSTALADSNPQTNISAFGVRGPKTGYWITAIRHEDEDPRKLDPQRFAYVAVPVDFPKHDKDIYIIDENNTVFRKVFDRDVPVTVFPSDLDKNGWKKVD
ncbi:MAG TPA: hypothetical protein VE981_06445 [Planctomycetota bacterium]|nr:hypothetical protein [Planctomycetota bacterium]